MDAKKQSIIGLVAGGVGLICCWVPLLGLAGGIVGLIFSVKAMKAAKEGAEVPKGLYIAGLICSIVGLALSVIVGGCIACTAAIAICGGASGSMS